MALEVHHDAGGDGNYLWPRYARLRAGRAPLGGLGQTHEPGHGGSV